MTTYSSADPEQQRQLRAKRDAKFAPYRRRAAPETHAPLTDPASGPLSETPIKVYAKPGEKE